MPTCSGSRACLLTGQGGAGNGMLGLAHRGWRAQRLPPSPRPHAARGRLPLDADRRAAHLAGAGRDRLRRGDPVDSNDAAQIAPVGDRDPAPRRASRSSSRSASSRPTATSPPRPRSATRSTRSRRRTCPTRRARARTWPRSRPAPARSTRGSARSSTACTQHGLVEQHADHLHHRPRARVPGAKATLYRPRHRRDADHARPGRLHGRQGGRRAGHPPRRLPDDLRPRRDRARRRGSRAAR